MAIQKQAAKPRTYTQKQYDQMQNKYNDLVSERKDHEKYITDLKGKIDLMKNESETLKEASDNLSVLHRELRKENEAQRERLTGYRKDAHHMEMTLKTRGEQIQEKDAQIQELYKQVIDAANVAKAAQETAKMYQIQNQALRDMEITGMEDAHQKIMTLFARIADKDVPFLMWRIISDVKQQQENELKYKDQKRTEINNELREQSKIYNALNMVMDGKADFLNL